MRYCSACGREFKYGLWNPKLLWHGITLLWNCPGLRIFYEGKQ